MSKLKYTDQRLTEGNETVGYCLKDYGSTNLVNMYRDYDVFFAHLQSTQRLGFLGVRSLKEEYCQIKKK